MQLKFVTILTGCLLATSCNLKSVRNKMNPDQTSKNEEKRTGGATSSDPNSGSPSLTGHVLHASIQSQVDSGDAASHTTSNIVARVREIEVTCGDDKENLVFDSDQKAQIVFADLEGCSFKLLRFEIQDLDAILPFDITDERIGDDYIFEATNGDRVIVSQDFSSTEVCKGDCKWRQIVAKFVYSELVSETVTIDAPNIGKVTPHIKKKPAPKCKINVYWTCYPELQWEISHCHSESDQIEYLVTQHLDASKPSKWAEAFDSPPEHSKHGHFNANEEIKFKVTAKDSHMFHLLLRGKGTYSIRHMKLNIQQRSGSHKNLLDHTSHGSSYTGVSQGPHQNPNQNPHPDPDPCEPGKY